MYTHTHICQALGTVLIAEDEMVNKTHSFWFPRVCIEKSAKHKITITEIYNESDIRYVNIRG